MTRPWNSYPDNAAQEEADRRADAEMPPRRIPVPKAVADASLDAAILVYLAKYPGAPRSEIECDRTIAEILARVSPESKARNWLSDRLGRLNDAGKIERRRGRVGWFPVTQERAA